MSADSPIVIRRARSSDVEAVHQFHDEHAYPFIAPRQVEFLLQLAQDGLLFIAMSSGDLVAICYVADPDDEGRWEFGGVFVRQDYRGRGLAKRMATVALSLVVAVDI